MDPFNVSKTFYNISNLSKEFVFLTYKYLLKYNLTIKKDNIIFFIIL